jgi:diguanylate cyclase (GGDEF)-like protein/PAS domain S-box-containing protein
LKKSQLMAVPDQFRASDISADDDVRAALPRIERRRTALEYEAILQNAWVGILFTRGRRVLHCNTRFSGMFGYGPADLAGQEGSILFPSRESFDDLGAIAAPRLAAGETVDLEWRMRRRGGDEFWCRLLAKAVSPSKPAEGTIWIAEDVSERRLTQESLRQLVREQQQLLDHATVGIALLRNRCLVRTNPRMEAVFGYAPGEMNGQSTRIVFPNDEAFERMGRALYSAPIGAAPFQGDMQLRRKDGSLFWARLLGTPLDPLDHDRGWIFVVEDITEQRQAKEALERARDELERRVRERTAELASTNEKLRVEIGERRQAEERARHLANHDVLTGLPNRRLLKDRLGQALALAHRHEKSVAVMFVDLDRFKTINDTLGHEIGDKLLVAVADRLKRVLREGDTVARVGGDEFVVVLPELGKDRDAAVVARKVLDLLGDSFRVESHELAVTPSIGIAVAPGDGDDPEELLRHSDAAMYEAKAAGRNTFHFHGEAAHQAASRRLSLESELRQALDRGEFELHFQPRVDIVSGELVGCEALARWRHPKEGLLPPERFIPLAQESGLIVPLGHWVVQAACQAAATWQRPGVRPRIVAVKLSAGEYTPELFSAAIEGALATTGLPASCLDLEIDVESLDLADDVAAGLARLQDLGVRITAERFRIGPEALLTLRRLRVDRMKVDLGAFRDVPANADEAAVATGLLQLAHGLGLEASVVSVETLPQLAFLRRLGCREAQGFLIARPLASAALVPLLDRSFRFELGG